MPESLQGNGQKDTLPRVEEANTFNGYATMELDNDSAVFLDTFSTVWAREDTLVFETNDRKPTVEVIPNNSAFEVLVSNPPETQQPQNSRHVTIPTPRRRGRPRKFNPKNPDAVLERTEQPLALINDEPINT